MRNLSTCVAQVLPVVIFIMGAFFLNPTTARAAVDRDVDGYAEEVDCDDFNASIYPGAVELCDGIDNNCNKQIDEDSDNDKDGYTAPCNHSPAEGDDCNDARPTIYPGAVELCDAYDNNCDGVIDEACDVDNDGDGFTEQQDDCDDQNATRYPGALETCDGIDNNCDGQVDEGTSGSKKWYYYDFDVDGFGIDDDGYVAYACAQPEGYARVAGDCDEDDPTVYPGATEICNGKNDDCANGVPANEVDADGDGYLICAGDCNDANANAYSGAVEVCDNADNDCDGSIDEGIPTEYLDEDGDGHGNPHSPVDCGDTLVGMITVSTADDCDDNDDSVYPGAEETCDGLDNNCNGQIDEDLGRTVYLDGDGDGYGGSTDYHICTSQVPSGYVVTSNDCDDTAAAIYPGAVEVCDSVDNNCDGSVDEGFTSCDPPPTDTPTPPTTTVTPTPDDGPPDSIPGDDDRDPSTGGGCNCSTSPTQPPGLGAIFFLGAVLVVITRKRS